MATEKTVDKLVKISIITVILVVFLNVLQSLLAKAKITLTHLGSGKFKTSPTEETVFEYMRDEPFTLTGYVNLKEMTDEDEITMREYVRLAVNGDYTLYAEEAYTGKQKEPMINIEKLPAMRGIKLTIQQTKGTPKYVPWEFYLNVVG